MPGEARRPVSHRDTRSHPGPCAESRAAGPCPLPDATRPGCCLCTTWPCSGVESETGDTSRVRNVLRVPTRAGAAKGAPLSRAKHVLPQVGPSRHAQWAHQAATARLTGPGAPWGGDTHGQQAAARCCRARGLRFAPERPTCCSHHSRGMNTASCAVQACIWACTMHIRWHVIGSASVAGKVPGAVFIAHGRAPGRILAPPDPTRRSAIFSSDKKQQLPLQQRTTGKILSLRASTCMSTRKLVSKHNPTCLTLTPGPRRCPHAPPAPQARLTRPPTPPSIILASPHTVPPRQLLLRDLHIFARRSTPPRLAP